MDDARAKWHHAAQLAISDTRGPAREVRARCGLGGAMPLRRGENKMGEGKLKKFDCSLQLTGIEGPCAALRGGASRSPVRDRSRGGALPGSALSPLLHDEPRRIGEPGS